MIIYTKFILIYIHILTVAIAHGCGLTFIEYSGLSHRYSNPVSMRGTLRAVDVDRMWLSVAGDKDGPNNATIPFPNNSHTVTNSIKISIKNQIIIRLVTI